MSLLMDALHKAEEEKKRVEAASNPFAQDSANAKSEHPSSLPESSQEQAYPETKPDRSEEPTIESSSQQNSMELMLEPVTLERGVANDLNRSDQVLDRNGFNTNTTINDPRWQLQSATSPETVKKIMDDLHVRDDGTSSKNFQGFGDKNHEQATPGSRSQLEDFELGSLTTRGTAKSVFAAHGEVSRSTMVRLGGLVLGSVMAALAGIGIYVELNLPSPSKLIPQASPVVAGALPQPMRLTAPAPTVSMPTVVASVEPTPVPTSSPTLAMSAAPTSVPQSRLPTEAPVSLQPMENLSAEVPIQANSAPIVADQQRPLYSPLQRTIEVSRGATQTTIASLVHEAYSAFRVGDFNRAESLYREALHRNGSNRDTLLGMGAIAVQRGLRDQAYEYYRQVLALDPKDPVATAALFSLGVNRDTENSEEQFKGLLAQNTRTPEVQFSLGNYYAKRARWADAQTAYFDAFSSDSQNCDYAFNLAVSLERLGQHKAALTYYERAMFLARIRPGGFNTATVMARINALRTLRDG